MRCSMSAVFVSLFLFGSVATATPQSLGIPSPKGGGSIAYDMNSAGQVAAVLIDDSGLQHGVFYENGKLTELDSLGGNQSDAKRINDFGEVIGSTTVKNGSRRAFLFDQENGIRVIGTLGGNSSQGTALNNQGTAVGYSDTGNGEWHAFLYKNGEELHDLGTLGGKISYANAINNKGQVVGAAMLANGTRHAFLYDSTRGMVDLGTLGGLSSSAMAINDNGIIVGSSQSKTGQWHAFTSDGQHMVDLGAIIGHGDSYATGINNSGDVVGTIKSGDVQMTFVWRDNKVILHSTGKSLFVVNSINNAGQVVGATYEQVIAGTRDQGYDAAAMPSNMTPYVDSGGSKFMLEIAVVLLLAIAAVIYRKRYFGMSFKANSV
ncbi:putative HAF family extracellular repeat protein [Oxalobacteraceae bacterium GrIS 2.11]